MNILRYLVPAFVFCSFNIITIFITKRKFGEAIPVTLMVSTLIVYFSQFIFSSFNVGIILLLILSIIGLVIFISKRQEINSNIFTIGLVSFISIYFIFVFIDRGRTFTQWDEFMHWGPMVKEMIRLDSFYSVDQSSLLIHKDYPPFISIFEMLWCRLTGGYAEAKITMSLHVFEYSMSIIPLIEIVFSSLNTFKEKVLNCIVSLFVFSLLILNYDIDGYGAGFSCAYIDIAVPLFYSFVILICINNDLRNSKYGYFSFLLAQFCLIITKQISITFVLLGWLMFSLLEISNKGFGKNTIIKIFLGLLVPTLSYFIWRNYLDLLNVSGQFEISNIKFSQIVDILKRNGTTVQNETTTLFVDAIINRKLGRGLLNFSYITTYFFIVIAHTLIYALFKNKYRPREFLIYQIINFVGTIGYCSTMYILYMFCFSETEMLRLACFERYFDTYVISEMLMLVFVLLEKASVREKTAAGFKPIAIIIALSFMLFDCSQLSKLTPQILNDEQEVDFRIRAEKILNLTEENSKVLILNNYGWYDQYVMNYYLDGRYIDTNYVSTDLLFHNREDSIYWDNFVKHLQEDDYVYIFTWELDGINSNIGYLTSNNEYYEGILYKVDKTEEVVRLIYIG